VNLEKAHTPMTIGILNSGGDCAGLNAVIAAIVKHGDSLRQKFIGFEKGWEGLLEPMVYHELDLDAVRGISHQGGTFLKTANKGRFAGKVGGDGVNAIPVEILDEAKNNLEKIGVDALIVIGGDGTLSAAKQLSDHGVKIVGVPKSIDNDLSATDQLFGFSTAVSVAVDALDKIHTTAWSHDRVFLVELMGRYAGWIALHAGLAANSNAILLPEFPVNFDSLANFLDERLETRGSAIIVVAEGADFDARKAGMEMAGSQFKLEGTANYVMQKLEALRPDSYEMRSVVLGHTQRGGQPNAEDRLLSKRYGIAALDAVLAGKFGQMVSLQNNQITTVSLDSAVGSIRTVTKDDPYYKAAKDLGIYVN
jgi:ATP-dependent phosphofructokinase / diphosphate-dependent phosphofructokinase